MTTQYTPILKLALPVQGELSGTWGDVVNDNITSMIEQAIAGRSVVNTWTANSHVLTTANGTAAESRAAMLSLTDTGTALTGAGSVVCPALSKTYIVKNGTAQVITVKTASGSGIAVPVGKTMLVYCDGTNVLEGVDHVVTLSAGTLTITGLTTFASLKGADATTVTGILDEDNMASDSATKLVTQQSVKAYVDSQVGANNELSEVLANGNTTGSNDIDVDADQKVQFRDASIYINSSADGQLDIVADTEIQIATATVDLNGNLDVSGTALVTGTLDVDGATQLDSTLTVGVNDTGHDVKFFGATSGAYMLWDESADNLILGGTAGLSVVGTATFTTEITANGGIALGDNDKATFGDSDDLEIYHNGNNSFIADTGTGSLYVRASDSFRVQTATNEEMIKADADGAVTLYYDSAEKLATTSTGINVTGNVVADGLTVDGAAEINGDLEVGSGGTGTKALVITGSGSSTSVMDLKMLGGGTGNPTSILRHSSATKDFSLLTGNSGAELTRLLVTEGGDISFYEDTGTTAKFFWDASEEKLGIGTTSSIDEKLTLIDTADVGIKMLKTGSISTTVRAVGGGMAFGVDGGTGTTERMRIDSSGNVGIGTSSPSSYFSPQLVVHSSSDLGGITIRSNATTDTNYLLFADGTSGNERYSGYVSYDHNTDTMKLATGASPAITIDSSQNAGIGTTDPKSRLEVKGTFGAPATSGSAAGFISRFSQSSGVGSLDFGFGDPYSWIQSRASNNYGINFDLAIQPNGGNVGIGTSSPSEKLHVNSGTGNVPALFQSTDSLALITFKDNSTSTDVGVGAQGNDQVFYAGSERMRIDSSGNVGIGASNPDTRLHLDEVPATIVGGNAINGSTMKGIKIETTLNGNESVGLWFGTNGSHWSGISGQRDNAAAGWGTDLRFYTHETGTSDITYARERMRIDPSGKVSIGSLSAAGSSLGVNHAVSGTYPKASGIGLGATSTAYTVASNGGTVSFTGGVGLYAENTAASGNPTNLVFWTNHAGTPAEAMRLDSLGNLLVGTSSSDYAVAGSQLGTGGNNFMTRSGAQPLLLNRLSNDGYIALFMKDGTVVGNIQSRSGVVSTIVLDPRSGQGAGLTGAGAGSDTARHITPTSESGAEVNGKVSLGKSQYAFKDLYLSGGVYLGGTGAANHLDDYEEGAWTPTLPNGGSLTVNRALYTKIGRQVTVQLYISAINATADNAQLQIGGLPFTSTSISNSYSAGSISYCGESDLSGLGLLNHSTYVYFHFIDGTNGSAITNNTFRGLLASASAGIMIAEISYFTD